MTELSGFSAVQKKVAVGPQGLRVPHTRDQLVKKASKIVSAMFEAIEAGLSPQITLEILQEGDAINYRIHVKDRNGVDRTIALAGHWLAVDGTRLLAMCHDEFAEHYDVDEEPETKPEPEDESSKGDA